MLSLEEIAELVSLGPIIIALWVIGSAVFAPMNCWLKMVSAVLNLLLVIGYLVTGHTVADFLLAILWLCLTIVWTLFALDTWRVSNQIGGMRADLYKFLDKERRIARLLRENYKPRTPPIV